jgi:HprK-related kinase A
VRISVHGNPLGFRIGPFALSLHTRLQSVLELVDWCYGTNPRADARRQPIQFNVRIERGAWYRRPLRPQARFLLEATSPFEPFPEDHAFPLFEWGLNWSIAIHAQQYLLLHAAVLERAGQALLLPATPGSGKSTLAAALALRGWRLLSDEFGIVDPRTCTLIPLPRAIPLKNRSIAVIRAYAPEAQLGPLFPRTRKGDVAHLRPPGDSLQRQDEPARPCWIVFPRYVSGSPVRRLALTKSYAFTRLAQNSFNYRLQGSMGFATLGTLVQRCGCWQAEYGDLDEMVATINHLPSVPQ